MSALLWLWLGGMLPVSVIALADRRMHPGDAPLLAWVISVVLWPIFAAHSTFNLLRGRFG